MSTRKKIGPIIAGTYVDIAPRSAVPEVSVRIVCRNGIQCGASYTLCGYDVRNVGLNPLFWEGQEVGYASNGSLDTFLTLEDLVECIVNNDRPELVWLEIRVQPCYKLMWTPESVFHAYLLASPDNLTTTWRMASLTFDYDLVACRELVEVFDDPDSWIERTADDVIEAAIEWATSTTTGAS